MDTVPQANEDTVHPFSEDALELIKASLPAGIDPRRLDLLPLILAQWWVHHLPEHLSRESRATVRKRYNHLTKIGKCATDLRQALEAIDQHGRSWIAQEIGREEESSLFSVSREKLADMNERLKQEDDFLGKITAATQRLIEEDKRGSGRPRNIRAYLVMMDLAAIFGWLTGRKAAREVDRSNGKEIGPFWHFAAAVWPHVFGRDRYGLSSAMKNWAAAHLQFGEESCLIQNIRISRPEMGDI